MTSSRWYTVGVIAAIVILIAFLYAIRSTLPPFLIAFAIAWLLDPVLDRLQKHGLRRVWAVLFIYVAFLAVFVVGLLFLVPAIIDQAKQLGSDFPEYSARFTQYASETFEKHHDTLVRFKLPTTLREVFSRYSDQVNSQIGAGVNLATAFITANLSRALWIILIPIIAFYFLMDIDRMRNKAALLLPESIRPRAVDFLSRVGAVFSSYVRGLLIVCLMYGIATTVVLEILHLKYGIILGLLAGILYAVPYLGAIVTMLLVFLVGLATYPHGVSQAIWPTLAMIVLNQLIFDPVITPRIIGKSVGLHPVLSLFALLAGGRLFGLVGMILAVPVAASIQEIVFEFCPQLKSEPKPPTTKKTKPKKSRATK